MRSEVGVDAAGRLPDFLGIGVPKGGTSSLFFYLKEHPDVWLPADKELHFFDNNFGRGEAWYRAQFAPAAPDQRAGELTPGYLDRPNAVERMAGMVPDARLIVMLRHPVERAYSHYQMQVARFPDAEAPFDKLVSAEMRGGPAAVPKPHYPYLRAGRYHELLQRLYTHYPRSAVQVLLMEDLQADPGVVFGEVCEHIGVRSDFRPANLGRRYNQTLPVRSKTYRRLMMKLKVDQRLPRSVALAIGSVNAKRSGYPELDAATRARLLEYYEPETSALSEMLGRDLSGWRA